MNQKELLIKIKEAQNSLLDAVECLEDDGRDITPEEKAKIHDTAALLADLMEKVIG